MIALDTNMLVRLVVDDHPRQTEIAVNLLKAHRVLIPRTVLLETKWVLRSCYRFPRERLHTFFQLFLQTENAVIEDSLSVDRALDWYSQGADFADALHLSACHSTSLHTLTGDFAKRRETRASSRKSGNGKSEAGATEGEVRQIRPSPSSPLTETHERFALCLRS